MSVYAVADLHGRYDLFTKIKEFLKPDDTLYVLGDCADRGPDGWKIIQEVYAHPQMIYLRGNHEELFAEAIKYSYNIYLHEQNGGRVTYEAWVNDVADETWADKLMNLPIFAFYKNTRGEEIILNHGGVNPDLSKIRCEEDTLWDRHHISTPWPDKEYENTYIVHGHTPVPLMGHFIPFCEIDYTKVTGPAWYCPDKSGKNHKVNIDLGAVFTGKTVLLDLDTWEEHFFKGEDCSE